MYKFLVIFLLFISGCGGTAYQPRGTDETGGYFHSKISMDEYEVGFAGNGFTETKRAYDYALLRAAELGQELGFRYFIIEGTYDKSTSNTYSTGSTSTINAYSYGSYTHAYVNTTPSTYTVHRPRVVFRVKYYESEPPQREGASHSVSSIIQALRAQHGL